MEYFITNDFDCGILCVIFRISILEQVSLGSYLIQYFLWFLKFKVKIAVNTVIRLEQHI